jgi:hypothetical protein
MVDPSSCSPEGHDRATWPDANTIALGCVASGATAIAMTASVASLFMAVTLFRQPVGRGLKHNHQNGQYQFWTSGGSMPCSCA